MSFLGIESERAPAGMRGKRFVAFLIDSAIVLVLVFIIYNLTGKPDFFKVQSVMKEAELAGGQDQELTRAVFTEFNHAFALTLLIAFLYEVCTQLLLSGATIGKRIFGLQTVPKNENRNPLVHRVLLCVRSAVKMLSIYLFQGFPFVICCLTIFTNGECRTGFDTCIKSVTIDGKENSR
ncbi:MAG: RDD family protein [Lachnospiraceae bacterium]|nr:RDD family protein [Lachnospiraceae bacterium]